AERKLNTEETVQEWVAKIRKQVAPFLDFDCGENSAIAANNYEIIMPAWEHREGAANRWRLSVVVEDEKGQRVSSNEITLALTEP
ncbi:hypothetical protein MJL33_30820, partial [Salmonella enterica subsp. enterica serovar Kentucky]|nr:hypothetical protein [Salmonella enterica subsp. enterica serovar Kentucky]